MVNSITNPAKYICNLTIGLIITSLLVNKAHAVSCYECDSSVDMTCGETLADGHTLEPADCSHLQEPLYCVKMTGLYEGQLGTKRFCSARDFGNYCEMVRRPGDERLYRACIYTCQTHACNSTTNIKISHLILAFCILTAFFLPIKSIETFS